jgi:hypothetical protein
MFAETRAPDGPSQRVRRCFGLGSTFIDLSGKVDSLPSCWRHPAHRTHRVPNLGRLSRT